MSEARSRKPNSTVAEIRELVENGATMSGASGGFSAASASEQPLTVAPTPLPPLGNAVNDPGSFDVILPVHGVVDILSASPHGNNFVAAWKAGYLVDTAVVRVGPIGGLTYSRVWIDAYTESGDPLLTQSVGKQDVDGLTGSLGVQFRLPTSTLPRTFNPFLNLTVEHDFIGNARVITTAQTYALGLPIATQVTDGHSQTYGKVGAGTSIDLGGRFSAMINAELTFARQGGNVMAVTAGFNARL
jgi:outer membrane autotransporter protein